MKVGADNRKELLAAIVLTVMAVVALYSLVERPAQTPVAAAPVQASKAKRQLAKRGALLPAQSAEESLDPTLRLSLLHAAEEVKYEGTGRNIFRAQANDPIPAPIKSPLVDKNKQTPIPTPTGPPPILLKFYGFAHAPADSRKKIFLSEGGNIFIASEGEVVNRRYRVVRVQQNSVQIEDLLNNNTQVIPLT